MTTNKRGIHDPSLNKSTAFTEAEKQALVCGIWIVFVVGAGAAAMVLHFGAVGMLGAVLFLIPLALREVQS